MKILKLLILSSCLIASTAFCDQLCGTWGWPKYIMTSETTVEIFTDSQWVNSQMRKFGGGEHVCAEGEYDMTRTFKAKSLYLKNGY